MALTQIETSISDFQWSPDAARIAFHAPTPESKERKERKEKYGDFEIVDEDITMHALWLVDIHSKRPRQSSSSQTAVWSVMIGLRTENNWLWN